MKKIGWLLVLAATAVWAQSSLDTATANVVTPSGTIPHDSQFSDPTGADAHLRRCLLRGFH